MMTVTMQDQLAPRQGAADSLSRLVNAIGKDCFGPALASYLHHLCGADHFAAFRLEHDALTEVAACCIEPEHTARDRVESYVKQGLWKQDPAMLEARRCVQGEVPGIIHVDFTDDGYTELRPRMDPQVRDRILMCGRIANAAFGLSVLRSNPHSPFTSDAIRQLADAADLLMALLGKHADINSGHVNAADSLTKLCEIEACICASSHLPRREAQVCSRVLYGMSSLGIALDLSVSEETVKTYRKRAYQRLAIGCERELLTWYLAHWSRWTRQRVEGAVAPWIRRMPRLATIH